MLSADGSSSQRPSHARLHMCRDQMCHARSHHAAVLLGADEAKNDLVGPTSQRVVPRCNTSDKMRCVCTGGG